MGRKPGRRGDYHTIYFEERLNDALEKLQKLRGGSFNSLVNFVVEAGFLKLQEDGLAKALREEVQALSKYKIKKLAEVGGVES